jgi:hypothetical protein
MEVPTPETVAAIVSKHSEALGLEQIASIESSLIGQGEASLNLLVTVNQSQKFNLRIGLRRFTLVHGDAHPLNILFDGATIRYIDWEQAAIGDPACDVAMVGWDIATPWQLQLTDAKLEAFLDAYLMLEADDSLPRRRDLWMVYTMCFDQMYHRTQIASDPTGKQANTVQLIETYLVDRFL